MKKIKLFSIIVLTCAFFLVSEPTSQAADCLSFATDSDWCILYDQEGGVQCSNVVSWNTYPIGDGQHTIQPQYVSCCGQNIFLWKAVQDYGCKPSGGPCVGQGGSCLEDSDCCYPFPEHPGNCVAGQCQGN